MSTFRIFISSCSNLRAVSSVCLFMPSSMSKDECIAFFQRFCRAVDAAGDQLVYLDQLDGRGVKTVCRKHLTGGGADDSPLYFNNLFNKLLKEADL